MVMMLIRMSAGTWLLVTFLEMILEMNFLEANLNPFQILSYFAFNPGEKITAYNKGQSLSFIICLKTTVLAAFLGFHQEAC